MWEFDHPQPDPKSLPYRWAVATDVGQDRSVNEDAYAIEPEAGLFLVIDGMGGHRGGQLASRIVAQDLPPAIETSLAHQKSRNPRAIRRLLHQRVDKQSQQLCREGYSEAGYPDMGATLVLTLLLDGRAYVANLGDSRLYRLRNQRLRQFSRDHSVVAELLERGRITNEEAVNHKDQGVITRYVGMDERAHSTVRSFTLKNGDRLLLCTDGLTDMIPDKQLRRLLIDVADCQTCCQTLVQKANEAGGHDNITTLIIDWQGSV